MKNYLKPTIVLIAFAATQAIAGIILVVYHVFSTLGPDHLSDMTMISETASSYVPDATSLSVAVIVAGLASVGIALALHTVDMHTAFKPGTPRTRQALLGVSGALCGIVGMNVLSERLELPDLMLQQFIEMARCPWGIIGMALVGPLVEEIIFREAILGHLLRKGTSPKQAIAASALAFALLHGNPAQVPFALVIGLILGFIRYRSGTILLTSLIHIANNSAAVLTMNLADDPEAMSFSDMLGPLGSAASVVAGSLLCAVLLWRFNKTTPTAA